jgi:hypothetical protein
MNNMQNMCTTHDYKVRPYPIFAPHVSVSIGKIVTGIKSLGLKGEKKPKKGQGNEALFENS